MECSIGCRCGFIRVSKTALLRHLRTQLAVETYCCKRCAMQHFLPYKIAVLGRWPNESLK
jgi:hypothetical protein